MAKTAKTFFLANDIENHMNAIAKLFKSAKVTIVVNTDVEGAHLVMSQDDLDNAIGIIRDTQVKNKIPTCIKDISFIQPKNEKE